MILRSVKFQKNKVYSDLRDAIKENNIFRKQAFSYQLEDISVKDFTFYSGNNKINLKHLSCSCNEFVSGRNTYEERDIRILCNHIIRKLFEVVPEELELLTYILLLNQIKFGKENLNKYSLGKDFFLAGSDRKGEWINVYAKSPNWKRFCFNVNENRWAFDKKPDKHEQIEKLITETAG